MAAKKTAKTVAQGADENSASTTQISLRGQEFVGTVVSAKAHRTVTVSWERRRYVPKYERYEKRRSKVAAHNPDEMAAKEGDLVRIKESRPLSKTKHFVVTEILTRNNA